jgi:hypothetical protein
MGCRSMAFGASFTFRQVDPWMAQTCIKCCFRIYQGWDFMCPPVSCRTIQLALLSTTLIAWCPLIEEVRLLELPAVLTTSHVQVLKRNFPPLNSLDPMSWEWLMGQGHHHQGLGHQKSKIKAINTALMVWIWSVLPKGSYVESLVPN